MTDDLSFKKGQMDLSKQTLSRLQAERANTERELAKMSELDERVPRQLHQLKDDCARCARTAGAGPQPSRRDGWGGPAQPPLYRASAAWRARSLRIVTLTP